MRVLQVCSELFPILKTGGLADVTAALPPALNQLGCDNRILLPGFPAFMQSLTNKKLVFRLHDLFDCPEVGIYEGKFKATSIPIYVIDAPGLYAREGNPYADEQNQAYPDNYLRFALLGWIAMRLATGVDTSWQPQIIHCHDWHAGLAPAYIKLAAAEHKIAKVATIFTIHNLAYQGLFAASVFKQLNLPISCFNSEELEFYGQISFLKAGLVYADKITTVSPTYASEIQHLEQGCGLDGVLKKRNQDLSGILNGVDSSVWDPAQDKALVANYTMRSMRGKAKCKLALQQLTGLRVQQTQPLFGVVSRLTEQKGINLLLEAIPQIMERGGQLVILGSGDSHLEQQLTKFAEQFPQELALKIGYDEEFAHQVIAGCDVIMLPSRFEPCGLTQLYGLSYGSLPLVRKVGGLADTVSDCSLENLHDQTASGMVFNQFNSQDLLAAIKRAFVLFANNKQWKQVQKTAMQQNHAWEYSAKQYVDLYHTALKEISHN